MRTSIFLGALEPYENAAPFVFGFFVLLGLGLGVYLREECDLTFAQALSCVAGYTVVLALTGLGVLTWLRRRLEPWWW